MNTLTARNAHEMMPPLIGLLLKLGVERGSRNGPVVQLPGPALLCYERPDERVIFWPGRDANPFFHLAESMWMLAGRDDVDFVAQFAGRMRTFSDDGVTLGGAYGHRWRKHFGYDQLDCIARNLEANPDCRRQVLSMWDSDYDLREGSLDKPCNTHAYFAVNHNGELDMTVCNRSNDLIWGCLGANAVHFSMLQEYMALKIGVKLGRYYQFTNNLHAYVETLEPLKAIASECAGSPYGAGEVSPFKLLGIQLLEDDLSRFGDGHGESDFFKRVYEPMILVHRSHVEHGPAAGLRAVEHVKASDWRKAATEWLQRRVERRKAKAQDDGVKYE